MQTTDEPRSSPATVVPETATPEAPANRGDADGGRPEGQSAAHARGPLPAPTRGAADDRIAGRPREIGGRDGPEPTRFGDWEKAGRCIDF